MSDLEDLLRELTPRVLGALYRRYGDFASCEDAVQEALLAAAVQWPGEGVPENPRAWLTTVATRRYLDQVRSDIARRRREDELAGIEPERDESSAETAALAGLRSGAGESSAEADWDPSRDDSLAILFLCCHPSLTPPSQIALTLRAVGGLTTAQIAAAFLTPEATMAQRISRAKQAIDAEGRAFQPPEGRERLPAVLHVLYLIFNEGYTASTGSDLTAPDLSDEAIRLTRLLAALVPDDPEVQGLLALMLLTDARRAARATADGDLIVLTDQDRKLWDRARIAEGVDVLTAALGRGEPGPYQLQAAIAAVHDEAETLEDTDWPQILGLYDLLEAAAPNPITALNRAVAVAMVQGPQAGLDLVAELAKDKRLARHHRLLATRAHLRELLGDREGAAEDYKQAAKLTNSAPEQRFLLAKSSSLSDVENGVPAPTSSRKDDTTTT